MKSREQYTELMARRLLADVFVAGGVVAIVVGVWKLHPAAGLVVAGIAAAMIGVGMSRNDS